MLKKCCVTFNNDHHHHNHHDDGDYDDVRNILRFGQLVNLTWEIN